MKPYLAWFASRRAIAASALLVIAAVAIAAFVVIRAERHPSRSVDGALVTTSRTHLEPSDPGFAQKVDWVSVCKVARTSNDDPILLPGQPGKSHLHNFSGNTGVTAFSKAADLAKQPTNCGVSADKSAYWMPSLLVDGRPVVPYVTRAYYRAATKNVAAVKAIPTGLVMIAGDPMATKPQKQSIAGFHCRIEKIGAIISKQATPPQCAAGAILEASVVFPNCWDGKHLDSADHRSHMSYARAYKCDGQHPVQLPQLTVSERFAPGTTSGALTLASMNSPYTLHADFLDGWSPSRMAELMSTCIAASVACATVQG